MFAGAPPVSRHAQTARYDGPTRGSCIDYLGYLSQQASMKNYMYVFFMFVSWCPLTLLYLHFSQQLAYVQPLIVNIAEVYC